MWYLFSYDVTPLGRLLRLAPRTAFSSPQHFPAQSPDWRGGRVYAYYKAAGAVAQWVKRLQQDISGEYTESKRNKQHPPSLVRRQAWRTRRPPVAQRIIASRDMGWVRHGPDSPVRPELSAWVLRCAGCRRWRYGSALPAILVSLPACDQQPCHRP